MGGNSTKKRRERPKEDSNIHLVSSEKETNIVPNDQNFIEQKQLMPKEHSINLIISEEKAQVLPREEYFKEEQIEKLAKDELVDLISSSKENREILPKEELIDVVLSWSLDDIFDENLYKDKVEAIPVSFRSVEQYLGSFVFPLLEETRSQLASSMEIINMAPFTEVMCFKEAESPGALLYDFEVGYWKNREIDSGKEFYRMSPGDVVVLSDSKPETLSNFQVLKWPLTLASIISVEGGDPKDGNTLTKFKAKSSRYLQAQVVEQKLIYAIFLRNILTNIRIWNALHMPNNLRIIQKVLHIDALDHEFCKLCSAHQNVNLDGIIGLALNSNLNECQRTAVVGIINKMICDHKSHVELIWGPPGTGKMVTVSMILFALLRMNYRTLCAPTYTAISQVGSCLIKLMKESFLAESGRGVCSLGNILLLCDNNIITAGSDLKKICLEYRVKRLLECLSPVTGWKDCIASTIKSLEDCVYYNHAVSLFKDIVPPLRRCMICLCTHVPKTFLLEQNFGKMVHLIDLLESLEKLLFQSSLTPHDAEALFSQKRSQCLFILKVLQDSLGKLGFPSVDNETSIIEFCFQMASLIFCSYSSSFKLNSINIEPVNLLVIDDATQLKESELLLPLQLQGLRHVLLAGDECQSLVNCTSKMSHEVGFGRSLFERLGSLGHARSMLDIQYRMLPSINHFPKSMFYHNKILDGDSVNQRIYLPERMFGSYSLINVAEGREDGDGYENSIRNMVEVAVVVMIVQKLYKAWKGSETSLSIGVISPYSAQVAAIQEKLRERYANLNGFVVKVDSVDGFQGDEKDVIIISTVRANNNGSLGSLVNPSAMNVSLTRARHCLWILGNERTLIHGPSVWESLVYDAKRRDCFFNANDDPELSKIILTVKGELDQLDDFLSGDSNLFINQKWKVLFSDFFRKSFVNLKSIQTKKLVIRLLIQLASGWRPSRKTVDLVCEGSSMILKQFKVQELYVLCTNDIVKEYGYIQVLKVWDILPLNEISKFQRRLDGIFKMYSDGFISRCNEKRLVGKLEIPMSWPNTLNITRSKDVKDIMLLGDGKRSLENSMVSESLLLVKFYSISVGIVNHLLLEGEAAELDAPFEVTDEELVIIESCRSCFILGRSGTGKTTVLIMKLFQKEQIHHIASEGYTETERRIAGVGKRTWMDHSGVGTTGAVLHQIFVTVNPMLCHAVKQQISKLKSFAGHADFHLESSSLDVEDLDVIERDIPDSFVGIPDRKYPLIITFQKFLMMLDGTMGDSFFARFHDLVDCSGGNSKSLNSVSLQTVIRMKEVHYEKFCSSYWPHFNAQYVKNLDCSIVFSEILSHIKGGSRAGEEPNFVLSQEAYVLMSGRKASTLSSLSRENIYKIFKAYENMKMRRREYDVADFVMNLHVRLENKRLEGDQMDFVYVDEVQDLSMRQIALFKYICKNVKEGFVFSGDTAQTISRGIDFRFQDIRSLFYSEFVTASKSDRSFVGKEKGLLTQLFTLAQNFRTHTAILKLAQSIIDLLYHFFPQSIDILKPEYSLIYGDAPVLLQPRGNEKALESIFAERANGQGETVGFGAEQVILVRDDSAKREVSDCVRNRALVLTIMECKGLEFEDVFLYKFFTSSPLGNQWRSIYEYMERRDLLDSSLPKCFPSMNNEKGSILCYELKQLYVAITRTRQRLWILESPEDFSNPMFDYWKMLGLVQVKQMNDSIVLEMQMTSSPAEWKSRGVKLYWQKNYETAEMCFKRSGDTAWERRAKASGLRETADILRYSDPKKAHVMFREAGEIFLSLGRFESAAECFCDLGDFERAGMIYLEKCGDSELKKAAECFTLARCFKQAAEVYAKGNYIRECLSVCKKGKLFDLGLRYVENWKQLQKYHSLCEGGEELYTIEQAFRESCALRCHKDNDHKKMMKYVRTFLSIDSKRNFLKSVSCFDELLLLEEESGNFMEAAEIAKQRGYLLLEADLLAKAGNFREASLLIISYVLPNSLWVGGSRGWPLKEFALKEEFLKKAISFSKQESDHFYEFVNTQATVLSHKYMDLIQLCEHFSCSLRNKNHTVELLSLRKILDAHFHYEIVKYIWEDSDDVEKLSKAMILKNQVSIGTLMYFWNLWKEKMLDILRYLEDIDKKEISGYSGYGEFCLNYFGARKQFSSLGSTYVLLKPDAEWVKKSDCRSMCKRENVHSVDVRDFSADAQSHLHAEMISVGLNVLETIEAVYNWSTKASLSIFCQSICLINMYQVRSFLIESFGSEMSQGELQRFSGLSIKYFETVFPLDCCKSLAGNMISLRKSEVSQKLLEEVIFKEISGNSSLTYGQIGRVAMILLGHGTQTAYPCKEIGEKIDANLSWKVFVESLGGSTKSESSKKSPWLQVPPIDSFNGVPESGCSEISTSDFSHISLIDKFHDALGETYFSNWRVNDYITPNCFVYLVERLLLLVCHSSDDFFYTSKYSFVEWLMYLPSNSYPSTRSVSESIISPELAFESVLMMVQGFLYNAEDTAEWIAILNLDINQYFPLLVLRLVMVMWLLCLNSGKHFDFLSDLLDQGHISSMLPGKFIEAFRREKWGNKEGKHLNLTAEAFKMIGNPLVIVSLKGNAAKISCPDAISIDIGKSRKKEDIMGILFPEGSN